MLLGLAGAPFLCRITATIVGRGGNKQEHAPIVAGDAFSPYVLQRGLILGHNTRCRVSFPTPDFQKEARRPASFFIR
jgi:hypothetical protein